MDVILKQDVDKLGYKNDLVTVKNGFGRNYLIPKGLAVLATGSARKMHEETLRQRAHKEEKIKGEATKAAELVKGMVIKIGAKVGEKGKIFGSVTNLQVADALNKLGAAVDKKDVTIKAEAIKQVGEYEADVRFHRDILETIKFEVVEE